MMIKKSALLFAFISILALCFALAIACGDDDDDNDDSDDDGGDDDDSGDDDDEDQAKREACEAVMDGVYNQCYSEFPGLTEEQAVEGCMNESDDIVQCWADCFAASGTCDEYIDCLNWCIENAGGDDDGPSSDCKPELCPEGWPDQPACADTTLIAKGKEWTVCDNGVGITHYCSQCYAENLTLSGHSDWRMPTKAELGDLYDSINGQNTDCGYSAYIVDPFVLTCVAVWAAEYEVGTSNASAYNFNMGAALDGFHRGDGGAFRALAVRDN